MELGNKILQLRKKYNLSQEQLAERMNVARQTISKWELGETSPDIKQAKKLSEIFNVSLDELVNNQVKDVLVEKVSNTEKLAGMIIKILRVIGILFIVMFVINIVAFVLFAAFKKEGVISSKVDSVTINCSIGENDYQITVASDAYFNCSNCSKGIHNDLNDIIDYSDISWTIKNISAYFNSIGGQCE